MFTFRTTARKFTSRFALAAGTSAALFAIASPAALASKSLPEALKADLAVCPGQTFAQTFAELGDLSYYTQVPSPTAESAEGWELSGGAAVVPATLGDGSEGSVIDLPAGAVAVSPPTCVTLQYPTARVFTNSVAGIAALQVTVVYASSHKNVAKVGGSPEAGWTLSEPFEVKPQLGGRLEETREVRFVFTANGKHSDTQLDGLFVDPRMV
jgi:hypothetical protein